MTIIVTEEYKKGACQCRNKNCRKVFHSSEIDHTYVEVSGRQVYTAACPYCGSTSFGLVNYPMDEEYLTYKDERFYGISNKRKKYIEAYENGLDEVIDELFI